MPDQVRHDENRREVSAPKLNVRNPPHFAVQTSGEFVRAALQSMLTRDFCEKPVPTFPHHAPRPNDRCVNYYVESRVKHVLIPQRHVFQGTLAAVSGDRRNGACLACGCRRFVPTRRRCGRHAGTSNAPLANGGGTIVSRQDQRSPCPGNARCGWAVLRDRRGQWTSAAVRGRHRCQYDGVERSGRGHCRRHTTSGIDRSYHR